MVPSKQSTRFLSDNLASTPDEQDAPGEIVHFGKFFPQGNLIQALGSLTAQSLSIWEAYYPCFTVAVIIQVSLKNMACDMAAHIVA
jgi:hypothetical protein